MRIYGNIGQFSVPTSCGWMRQEGASFASSMQGAKAAEKSNYLVYLKTDDMLYSGGNGTGLSFYLKYAEGSTEENPLIVAKGIDENGNEFEKTIAVNGINPQWATVVEMRALEAHLGADKGLGLSSFSKSTGGMGLNDRRDFFRAYQKDIADMKLLGEQKRATFYAANMQLYMDFYYNR